MTHLVLVVVDNLDIFGGTLAPAKAKASLIVDSEAVLARTVALERFQSVARRHPEIIQLPRDFQLPQLAACHGFDGGETSTSLAASERFSVPALEGSNHRE